MRSSLAGEETSWKMAEKTKRKRRQRLSRRVGRLEKFYATSFVKNLFLRSLSTFLILTLFYVFFYVYILYLKTIFGQVGDCWENFPKNRFLIYCSFI